LSSPNIAISIEVAVGSQVKVQDQIWKVNIAHNLYPMRIKPHRRRIAYSGSNNYRTTTV
jgi:hypothetical protein